MRVPERLKVWLGKNPAALNVFRLLAGNASAQILTLAAYPVLTRIYTPQEIGVLSILMAAVSILAPTASMRLEMALPLSRTDREAGSMLAGSAMALVLTTLLTILAMVLLPTRWPDNMQSAAPYRWFLPAALFAFGGYVIMVNEATRRNRFGDIARTRVVQAVSGPACQIGFGLLGFGVVGLMVGYVIGQSSGTLRLARQLLSGPESPLRRITWASVRAGIHRHRNFMLFSSWTGVINAAASYVMTIAFAFLYGPAISAFMFLGERVLMRPLFLITSAILPVYTREVAKTRLADISKLPALFLGVTTKQAILSLAWIVPIAICAPYVIPAVFGSGWGEAAKYVQILAIGYFPTSVLNPVMHTLQMLSQQKLSAAMDVGRSIAVFGAIGAVAWLKVPPLEAALVCSSVQAIAMVVILFLTWKRVRRVASGL